MYAVGDIVKNKEILEVIRVPRVEKNGKIHPRIKYKVKCLNCGNEYIIDSASIDAETKNLLNTNIVDDGSFFKTYIGSRINDAVYVSELISSLRIYIAKNCQIRQPSIDDYIKRKQEV